MPRQTIVYGRSIARWTTSCKASGITSSSALKREME
jgi:hypothetical protein